MSRSGDFCTRTDGQTNRLLYPCACARSNNRSSPNNYRPASLLPILSKLLEKHIHGVLFHHLETTQPISNYQWGFQAGKSTVTTLNYSQLATAQCLKTGLRWEPYSLILRRLSILSLIGLYFRNLRIWVSTAIYCGGFRATSPTVSNGL